MDAIDTIPSSWQQELRHRDARFDYDPQRTAGSLLSRLWHRYCALAAKKRSRLALEELSTHMLEDIGLTEAEARREAAVPFWR